MRFQNRQPGIFCLNEGWRFTNEPFTVFLERKKHNQAYAFAKAGGAGGPAAARFDDSEWETVRLPHDWVTQKPFDENESPNHGYKERGMGWYRLRFLLDETDRDRQILLEFEGVTAEAKIYVNGTLMKCHLHTYNSFTIDMTDIANFGTVPNTIAVFIDARSWEGWWYEGAGIYRSVWLYKKSAVHIAYDGVFVKPVNSGEGHWDTRIQAELENTFLEEREVEILSEVIASNGRVIASGTSRATVPGMSVQTVRMDLPMENPVLWDLDTPELYQCKTTVLSGGEPIDFLTIPFGYRTIRLDADTGFWLNGRNLKLKGTCNHHDHTGVGAAVPYAVKEYRIRKLLELGANAYRCAHNPDPEILEICDRLGMLVMNENRMFSTDEQTCREVQGIVKGSRNHPSVIFYSVFNEEPWQGNEKGNRLAARLQHLIKELDDTRPVLGAFNGGFMEKQGAAGALEAVGINYNPGGYAAFHQAYPRTPIVASETSSAFMVRGEYETNRDRHVFGGFDEDCAEWGQTARDAWKYVDESPYVAETFVWTGFDYRGEPTPFTWPSVATFFGIYDSCGFEKEACYLYQALWKKEPVVHVAADWNRDAGEGEPVKVMVFSNCEEIQLSVNGRCIAREPVKKYEQNTFTVPYEPGELKAEGYCGGEPVVADGKCTLGTEKVLVAVPHQKECRNDGLDAIVVDISLVDERGTLREDSDALLSFTIKNGTILGVGNGNPNSREEDVAENRQLFHGRAQLIVRNTGVETVEIAVSCGIADTVHVSIPVCETEDSVPYILPVQNQILDGWKIYHKLFDEMPDANLQADINDMNSFEPISFQGTPQPLFEGHPHSYGMYRVTFLLPAQQREREISFPHVMGAAWVYLNGKLVHDSSRDMETRFAIPLPEDLSGTQEMTVILQHKGENLPGCGIIEPVRLNVK